MNSETPGVLVSEFSGVAEPTPRMVTRFSKPEALVTSRLGTVAFRPAMLLMNDLSSCAPPTAVIARGARCRLTARRSAVTTTSVTWLAPAAVAATAALADSPVSAWAETETSAPVTARHVESNRLRLRRKDELDIVPLSVRKFVPVLDRMLVAAACRVKPLPLSAASKPSFFSNPLIS